MTPDLIQEIRKQYNDLVEAMESEGVCVKRDCMCDTSAPVVKLGAAITELEQKFSLPVSVVI